MPFKPGDPNINRSGRPVGSTSMKHKIEESFLQLLSTPVKKGNSSKTFHEAFLEKLMKDALAGEKYASSFVAERLLVPDVLKEMDQYINSGMQRDVDFQRYRVHLLAHDIQQQYLDTKERTIYQMAGRRAGKTEGHILKALHIMVAKPEAKALYIARTIGVGMDQLFNEFIKFCDKLGLTVVKEDRSEGKIRLDNGSEFHINGNNSKAARENMRGGHYDLIIIDEAQSQDALSYLINDICTPMLIDTKGTLVVSGTGPRAAGSYWEEIWTNRDQYRALRMNWNLLDNPFIDDGQAELERIRQAKGLTETSPLYQREYLGLPVYDEDAMVFRMGDNNIYSLDQFNSWVNSQPIDDIRLTAGLDYGYSDCDAFTIIAYSKNKEVKEKFILFEYKKNRTGITELAGAIKDGIELVKMLGALGRVDYMPLEDYSQPGQSFQEQRINKKFYIYCDTNEQKISQELFSQFKLPVTNAYKYDKSLAIEMLQEDVRCGHLKVPSKDSPFYQESLKTLWKRNDKDEIVREIDDDNYHPDVMDSVIYALRSVWKMA